MKGPQEELSVKVASATAPSQSSTKSQASLQDGCRLEPSTGVNATGSAASSPATASGVSPSTRAASPRGVAADKIPPNLKYEDDISSPDGESESEYSTHDSSNLSIDNSREIDWPPGENLSPLPLNYNKGGYPVCKVCGKVFKHQGSLVAHYQVHQLRTKCPVCRKVLSRHYHMKVHLLTVHKVPDAEIEGLLRSQNIV